MIKDVNDMQKVIQIRVVITFIAILSYTVCSGEITGPEKFVNTRQKVILDTDLDSDVDDVGALAMLLNLNKAGIIDLIGVIVTSNDPYAPVCAAAINTFYGFPDIPVGFLKDQPVLTNHSRYTKFIAGEFLSGMNSWEVAEDAILLYRRLLASNPEESVVILTIGHLSSLQGLLKSLPDKISPYNGKDLVKDKIKKWICMGGQFPDGKEANFYRPDPGSTVYCVNQWEKEVLFCGWEVGNKVITGGDRLKNKYNSQHPLYRAYELFNGFTGRQSWDQIAVLQMDDHSRKFFLYVNGTCIVAPDGSNSWKNDINGRQQYVVLNPSGEIEDISYYIDRMMTGEDFSR